MILKVIDKKVETRDASRDAFSLILEKPNGFNFYPGQYLDVKLPVKDKYGNTRAFTISSSPTEHFLMITPKKGISEFKKKLASIKSGDTISVSHPAGTFTLDESSPAIFIAGGVGITPFRSIIKYVLDQKLSTSITLLYFNSTKDFLFQQELEEWKNQLSNLRIIYHQTSENGHLTQLLTAPSGARYQLPIYYLAGPPKMVDNFEKILLKLGIDETSIRTDRFDGY